MRSAEDLVEEALGELSGHTAHQGQVTELAEVLEVDDTTLKVDDVSGFSRGIIEVGDELIRVKGVGSSPNTLKIASAGRGYRGSEATEWPAGTEVTMQPRFPRHLILQRINDVIAGAYPDLFAVGEETFNVDSTATISSFEVPADCEDVISVHYKRTTEDVWRPLKAWRLDGHAGGLVVRGAPYTDYRVVYKKHPESLSMVSDWSVTGLPDTAWQVALYGALHRLSASLTLGTLDKTTASSGEYGRQRDVTAVDVSRQYYALYQQFLGEEIRRLQDQYPPQPHLEL